MTRRDATQLNIRSSFAKKRTRELAKRTGMTAAQIVEDALRGYVPLVALAPVGRLEQRGRILVCQSGKRKITLREANAALDAERMQDS